MSGKNPVAKAPQMPSREELMAQVNLLQQQLEELGGNSNFTPTDMVDAEDISEVSRSAAAGQAQRQRAESRYSGTQEVHAMDHEHDVEADGNVVDRETEVVEWHDPSNLEAPPPRPGMVQRWVRSSFRTGEDPGNIMRARREGWRPRAVSTVDKGYAPATILHKTFGEVIAVEGLILCEMPIGVARQRYQYYRKLLLAQNEAINRDIHRDERPGHPIIAERRATVTKGRRPQEGD